ncbi:MAG: hypothetical protein NXI32_03095 [bacterium]|nr:hypothetical protein [bacterium]
MHLKPAPCLPLIIGLTLASLFNRDLLAADPPWYQQVLVGIETGPTGAQFGHSDLNDTRYCRQFNGAEIVRQALACQAEYLVMWARDGDFAYYDSKILPKAPGLGTRDPLREAVDEAAKSNLPVIAYCVVQQAGHFLDAHPEWQMRDSQGHPLGRFCFNSGYLEALQEILAEQMAYGVHGFHIDMLDQGFGKPYGCWCDSCRNAFEKEYGVDMPSGLEWDASWEKMLEFRYQTSERFERSLHQFVKGLNPQVSVDFNYHGNPPFSLEVGQRPVQHAGNGDFITGETGVWGFSALTIGLNAAFYRAAVPHQRVQVAMQRGVRMYHDQTTRPLNDIRWELLTLLAHGAFVTIVDKTAFDGQLDSRAYERFTLVFEEARKKRAHFGQPAHAEVGIYFSSRTRDWIGRDQPQEYFQSFLGAHKALVYEHIPWGVVLDENLDLTNLKRFPIILLANTAILTDRESELLQRYVKEGGKLIVTGHSGQFDRLGKPLPHCRLQDLIGASVQTRLASQDNWFAFSEEDKVRLGKAAPNAFAALPTQSPVLVKGPASVFQADAAQAVGQLLRPFRTTRQQLGQENTDWPMSADQAVGPAILLNSYGAGQVLTFAGSPDYSTASEHHTVETRRLLRQAVRMLAPEPRIKITAPTNVEAIVTDDRQTRIMRVHLLGYNPPPQTIPSQNRPYALPALMEDRPLYRVQLELNFVPRKIHKLNASTLLEHQERSIRATIDDIHEAIVIEY